MGGEAGVVDVLRDVSVLLAWLGVVVNGVVRGVLFSLICSLSGVSASARDDCLVDYVSNELAVF